MTMRCSQLGCCCTPHGSRLGSGDNSLWGPRKQQDLGHRDSPFQNDKSPPASFTASTRTMNTRDQKVDLAALEDTERGIHVPSLPLELWLLIFSQYTDPQQLWITGRQVCSTWRSEIPKVIAKKYLENPQMTQIHAHCLSARRKHLACLMGRVLRFSHYEGKTRAVFKPAPREWDRPHDQECRDQITSAKMRDPGALGFSSSVARRARSAVRPVWKGQVVDAATFPHTRSGSSGTKPTPSFLA